MKPADRVDCSMSRRAVALVIASVTVAVLPACTSRIETTGCVCVDDAEAACPMPEEVDVGGLDVEQVSLHCNVIAETMLSEEAPAPGHGSGRCSLNADSDSGAAPAACCYTVEAVKRCAGP
jgi:hypothetical protein